MDSPVRERDGWKDGETSYVRVNVWHDLAEHVVDSLSKGDRVVVVGRLRTRAWETPEGDKRSVVGVVADEIGPSLRFATAKPQQTRELATATPGLPELVDPAISAGLQNSGLLYVLEPESFLDQDAAEHLAEEMTGLQGARPDGSGSAGR